MNDLVDLEGSFAPPSVLRPLPAGTLNRTVALIASIALAAAAVGMALLINPWVEQTAALSWAKHTLLVLAQECGDCGCDGAGAGLPARCGGSIVANVTNFSPWLYVCVTLLALFLGFGKRRHELSLLADGASGHIAHR